MLYNISSFSIWNIFFKIMLFYINTNVKFSKIKKYKNNHTNQIWPFSKTLDPYSLLLKKETSSHLKKNKSTAVFMVYQTLNVHSPFFSLILVGSKTVWTSQFCVWTQTKLNVSALLFTALWSSSFRIQTVQDIRPSAIWN